MKMEGKELTDYIIKQRDEHGKTFDQITEELKKRGVKSIKNKPHSLSSIKHKYFYGSSSGDRVTKKQQEKATVSMIHDQITTIDRILATKTLNSDQKVEMIELILAKRPGQSV